MRSQRILNRASQVDVLCTAGSICASLLLICALIALLPSAECIAAEDESWDADDGTVKATLLLPSSPVELATREAAEILVLAPPGTSYSIWLPDSEWVSHGIEVIGDGPVLLKEGDGKSDPDRWEVRFMPMDTGELHIPGPIVEYSSQESADVNEEGLSKRLELPLHTLKVENPLKGASDEQLRPMKDPIPAQVDYTRPLRILLIAIGAVAIVAALVWFLRRRLFHNGSAAQEACTSRPAHEIAYDRLRSIERARFIERGLHREFHFAISECLREYLENRYSIPALEMTTEEFLDYSQRQLGLPEICRSGVADLMRLCDLVKFAKRDSLSEEMKQVLKSVYKLIDQTKDVDDSATSRESLVIES